MGFRTLTFTTDTFPVPNEWIFETFLSLTEKLIGQSVSVKSIFNSKDSKPSMVLYVHDSGKYKFKDFSSGLQGDAIDLIRHYHNITREEAFVKIFDLYQGEGNIINPSGTFEKIEKTISQFEIRKWNTYDAKYWLEFKINSNELERYNIKPLASYVFQSTNGTVTNKMVFQNEYSYGFFRANGELYKIYNPKSKRAKFIKVKNYIQGHDQLEYKAKWLMLLSSLKDILAFNQLGYKNIECIAPDSENTMLSEKQMEYYKKRYSLITVLFDNDVAGKNSSLRYNADFGLPVINFEIEKDISDCLREHDVTNTKIFLTPLLKLASNEFKQNRNSSK